MNLRRSASVLMMVSVMMLTSCKNTYENGFNQGEVIGYDNGYDDGQDDGYDSGFADGETEGYDAGETYFSTHMTYEHGHSDGMDEGLVIGYGNGYNNGMTDGLIVNYDDGYDDGNTDGLVLGYDLGYDDGADDGYDFSYNQGYNTSYSSSYNNSYDDGYDNGYDDGYFEDHSAAYNNAYFSGYFDGDADGYDDGYDNGILTSYWDGYDDGFIDGDYVGFSNGYGAGVDDGYDLGFDDGYDIGFDDGYDVGYDDAIWGFSTNSTVAKISDVDGLPNNAKNTNPFVTMAAQLQSDLTDFKSLKKLERMYMKGVQAKIFEETGAESKDLAKLVTIKHKFRVASIASSLTKQYGLNAKRSTDIARLSTAWRKLANSRAVTKSDSNNFAKEMVGLELPAIEKAVAQSLKGNVGGLNTMLAAAAKKNQTSKTNMAKIIFKLFY